ncbi:MAG: hypothetical protein U0836_27130, partial [Pirellulales bacterium]
MQSHRSSVRSESKIQSARALTRRQPTARATRAPLTAVGRLLFVFGRPDLTGLPFRLAARRRSPAASTIHQQFFHTTTKKRNSPSSK